MAGTNRRIIGCNVIDPLLQVKGSLDYDVAITERSLEFLKEIGHDATEFSHGCHWTPDECEQVRAITERVGIEPWSLHTWAAGDAMSDEGAEKVIEGLGIAFRNALALGTGRIIYHPSGKKLDAPEDQARLAREAELIAGVWQPGVRIALENMQTLGSMEYLIGVVDALGPERAGVCVDTGHAALGDLGAGRAIRMAGERLITTHIQDNLGERDDHMPPWDGTIDWDDVVAALAEVGYAGCVQLELTDQPSDPARRPVIKEELKRGQVAAKRIADALPWPVE